MGSRAPGHGPFYAFTRKVGGQDPDVQLRPGARLTKLEREVETYRPVPPGDQELVEVNEGFVSASGGRRAGIDGAAGAEKKIAEIVQAEVAREVEGITSRSSRLARSGTGGFGGRGV